MKRRNPYRTSGKQEAPVEKPSVERMSQAQFDRNVEAAILYVPAIGFLVYLLLRKP